MQLAIIENNVIIQTGEHYELFPNTIFPETGDIDDFLVANSAMKVINWIPFDESIENLPNVEPYIEGGLVYTCRKVAKTELEVQEYSNKLLQFKAQQVRNQRNQLLIESDWTQVADAPVDKIAWAVYRQALRDVTAQEGFPNDVTFPNPPL